MILLGVMSYSLHLHSDPTICRCPKRDREERVRVAKHDKEERDDERVRVAKRDKEERD